MISPSQPALRCTARRPSLGAGAALLGAIWALEIVALSYLVQRTPVDGLAGTAETLRAVQHWLFRFLIAYGFSVAILWCQRSATVGSSLWTEPLPAASSPRWWALHVALLPVFALVSLTLYRVPSDRALLLLMAAWHGLALAAAATSLRATAPLALWRAALRDEMSIARFAVLPAAAAVLIIKGSQVLWAPAARLTFTLVGAMLGQVCTALQTDFGSMSLSTPHFSVVISEQCSGLEGVGMMLVFGTAWLGYFRREYRWPRALVIVPAAMALMFLLNAVRIATLVLIGDSGHARIAMLGFHSQAGWIAFNVTALCVAYVARRSLFSTRVAAATIRRTANPTAAYVIPLVCILATGMVTHALSAEFELLYPLRLVSGAAALWICRRQIAKLDWGLSWRGFAVGASVFCIWLLAAQTGLRSTGPPAEFSALSGAMRISWLGLRVAAAVITVPLAEELAYRGFLMRRLVQRDFDNVALRSVRGLPILVSALVFGATHGALWLPGVAAGLAYALLAARTGRMGEAVFAHATTNALLAGYVLMTGNWQLW